MTTFTTPEQHRDVQVMLGNGINTVPGTDSYGNDNKHSVRNPESFSLLDDEVKLFIDDEGSFTIDPNYDEKWPPLAATATPTLSGEPKEAWPKAAKAPKMTWVEEAHKQDADKERKIADKKKAGLFKDSKRKSKRKVVETATHDAEVKEETEAMPPPEDVTPPPEIMFNYELWREYGHNRKWVRRFHRNMVFVSGWTKFAGVERYVHQYVYAHKQGTGNTVGASDDGCLLLVRDGLAMDVEFRQISDKALTQSVKSTIGLVDLRYKDGFAESHRRAKAHYKRFHPEVRELDAALTVSLNSEWYGELNAAYWEEYNKKWLQRTEARLGQTLGHSGLGLHEYIQRHLPRFTVRLPRAAAREQYVQFTGHTLTAFVIFAVLAACDKMIAPLYMTCLMVTTILYGWLGIKSLDYFDILRLYDKQLHGRAVPMKPCAMVLLRQSNVDPRRIPEPQVDLDIVRLPVLAEPEDIEEKFTANYGTTIQDVPIVIPQQSNQELMFAFMQRMAQKAGNLDDMAVADFLTFARAEVDALPRVHFSNVGHYEHFCKKYGKKRAVELELLRMEPMCDADTVNKGFVKAEGYGGKDDETYKSRMILQANEKMIAHYSLMFYELQQMFAAHFNDASDECYASKMTPDNAGRYVQRKVAAHKHTFELDVASWDGSLSQFFVILETYIIQTVIIWDDADHDWIVEHWATRSVISRDGTMLISFFHGRITGCSATTQFNSAENIWVQKWVFKWGPDSRHATLVAGDDGVTGTDDDISDDTIISRYAMLGLKVEIVRRENPMDLQFCSGTFWPVNGIWRWQTLPFRMLCKLGFNHSKQPEKFWKGLLHGTARSMGPIAGTLPIVGTILDKIISSAEDLGIDARRDRTNDNPDRIQGGPVVPWAMDTLGCFSARYGIAIEAILELEEAINCTFDIAGCPYVFTDPEFVRCAQIDLGWADNVRPGNYEYKYSKSDRYTWLTVEVPQIEEMEKLQGCATLAEAMKKAYDFGCEEDEEAGTTDHCYLHMAFTFISWHNLRAGVAVHGAYNRAALRYEYALCARRNAKRQGKGQKKQKEKGQKRSRKKRAAPGNDLLVHGAQLVGGMIGGPVGSNMAGAAVRYLANLAISGRGDYKLKYNTLLGGAGPPSFGSGNVRVRHREYLTNIESHTTFTSSEFILNPGSSTTFPWLSSIARRFQECKWHGMVFEYISKSADALNSTNTALGSVVFATQYNVYEPSFTSRIAMQNTEFSTTCKPSENMIHGIECDPKQNPLKIFYIKEDDDDVGGDERFYDLGITTVATINSQATCIVGDLWISYDVELSKPILDASYVEDGPLSAYISNGAYNSTDVMGISQNATVGNLDINIVNTVTGHYDTIVFPSGSLGKKFLCVFVWKGVSTALISNTVLLTGLTAGPNWVDGASTSVVNNGSTTSTKYFYIVTWEVTDSALAFATMSGGTMPGTPAFFECAISEIDASFVSMEDGCVEKYLHPEWETGSEEEQKGDHPSVVIPMVRRGVEEPTLKMTAGGVRSRVIGSVSAPRRRPMRTSGVGLVAGRLTSGNTRRD